MEHPYTRTSRPSLISRLLRTEQGRDSSAFPEDRPRIAGRYGIVDIGSNSVRLVVYQSASRNPVVVFNEKAMCGLGRTLSSSGRLAPDGIEQAYNALRRFVALRDQIGIEQFDAVATAAVRDAEDGPAFLRMAESILGQPVRLLSGQDEAKYAALGCLSGIPEAEGLVGDLGGGSLEIVPVKHGAPLCDGVSTQLGPLRLMDWSKGDLREAEKIVDRELAQHGWLKKYAGQRFYAVGGTWRNLARIHMAHNDYPIHVLHNYVMPAQDMVSLTGLIERLGPKSLAQIPDVSERRIEALPYGALLMNKVLEAMQAREVVISAYGLREGILFEQLPLEEQNKDPLLAGAHDFAGRLARFPEHGDEFTDWTAPLFADRVLGETSEEARLRRAACILADIAWYVHPDYRAQHCLTELMVAPFSGIDHLGRLFLARVGYHRHEGKSHPPGLERASSLLPARMNDRALVLGLALRLAFTLCAATTGVLPRSRLEVTPKEVLLVMPSDLSQLIGEVVEKRLNTLAKSLNRRGRVIVEA